METLYTLMYRSTFLIVLLSTLTSLAVGQNVNILLVRPAFKEVPSIEAKSGGSKFRYNFGVSLPAGYFPDFDKYKLAQPIPYGRPTAPIKTTIDYYFSVPDSTVRLVEYAWNGGEEKTNDLRRLFDSNTRQLSKYFKNSGDVTNEDHSSWSQKTIVWENILVHVKQFIVTGAGNNKVRVLVSWK